VFAHVEEGAQPMSLDRRVLTAPQAPAAAGPYSHAVRSQDLLFLSGQIPLDPDTGALVDGDIRVQTDRCLQNLALVAAAAGGSLAGAVRCGIYVTDMATFADVNAAYAAHFGDDPPARTTIGVAALPLGAGVEIDAIVAVEG
jgi:2-iminobutanoate/2-iminopropanoate deaminase